MFWMNVLTDRSLVGVCELESACSVSHWGEQQGSRIPNPLPPTSLAKVLLYRHLPCPPTLGRLRHCERGNARIMCYLSMEFGVQGVSDCDERSSGCVSSVRVGVGNWIAPPSRQ